MRNRYAAEGTVRDILSQDPIWAAYAIADLRPELTAYCRWLVAPDASGLALLFAGLTPPILLTAGSPEGVATALADADLPERVFLSVLPSHLPALESFYPHVVPQEMLRMVFPSGKPASAPTQLARRLSQADESRLSDLYQHGGDYAPDAFDRSQLFDDFFYGIEDEDGSLASAGGTHVAYRSEIPSPFNGSSGPPKGQDALENIVSHGVAAIGNIYTRPDRRGLGYGKAVTTSITRALREEGYGVIVLNVGQRNLVARFIYEKLGFEVHCHFIEGFASIRRESWPPI